MFDVSAALVCSHIHDFFGYSFTPFYFVSADLVMQPTLLSDSKQIYIFYTQPVEGYR